MTEELKRLIESAISQLYNQEIEAGLSRPDENFGDYATNVALQLGRELHKKPLEIAKALADRLSQSDLITEAKVAGPGFINIRLTDEALAKMVLASTDLPRTKAGQEILVEYGDPNPFKEMHIGHVYAYIAGDGVASLLEAAGAEVRRLSYHGDVGLHVAKAIWSMQKQGPEDIAACYVAGARAYDDDPAAKQAIDKINRHIYAKDDEAINKLYEQGRKSSLDQFASILAGLNVGIDKQYFESQAEPIGTELVMNNKAKVFSESKGAIIYEGEKVGLHTRVFITSAGLPTYETKDLGLAKLKDKDYPQATQSVIITAHEQAEYFKVMLAALAEIDKPLADKTKHLYHGFVSLSSGKMSSRTGAVYSARHLLDDVDLAIKKQFGQENDSVRNAAVKYGFLKHRLGGDIIYDVAESVSLEGNSGPYLQYAHARAASILAKSDKHTEDIIKLDADERRLALKISQFPEVVEKSVEDLLPSHICSYLYELCQSFNRFYEHCRVVGDEREAIRGQLVWAYKNVLASGLGILNIDAPEKL